jgi:protein-tyrosine phosphatase
MQTVLFICTGNVFRSMTAELALRHHLGTPAPYAVASAGTTANPQPVHPAVRERLAHYGLDPQDHRQRRLDAALLDAAALPVAMSLDHRAYVRRHFGRDVLLFNQICYGREAPILDLWEAVPDGDGDEKDAYVHAVVDTLWQAMPDFLRQVRAKGLL